MARDGIPEFEDIICIDRMDSAEFRAFFGQHLNEKILIMLDDEWLNFIDVRNGWDGFESIWDIQLNGQRCQIGSRMVNKGQLLEFLAENYPVHFDMFLFHHELLG